MRKGVEDAYGDDDTLTVAEAARVARRSVRTIRRAYLSGTLLAHRDGNGRSVSIRYSDLRRWLLAEVITPVAEVGLYPPTRTPDAQTSGKAHAKTGNLELLIATLERRQRATRAAKPIRARR